MFIRRSWVFVCLAILVLGGQAPKAEAQQCNPVSHAVDDWQRLNQFWGVNVTLCRLPDGAKGAFAYRAAGIVTADQEWLDEIAQEYGSWASTGVLAHEWGHMVQGNVPGGTAAELQADCLAGIFMRGAGLSPLMVEQFARLNLSHGDPVWSFAGHGLGQQRYIAAARGYNGFPAFTGMNLAAICPYSAF